MSDRKTALSSSTTTTTTFHCSICNVVFHDSEAVLRHKASRRHRLATGQVDRDKRMFKPDAEVVPEDIVALCRAAKKRSREGNEEPDVKELRSSEQERAAKHRRVHVSLSELRSKAKMLLLV